MDPCSSDPCGPHSQCRVVNNFGFCSCLPGYEGSPPNCRPECSTLACINQKCRDPCPGACGASAECEVINHNAVCRCQQGFEGDPYEGCQRVATRGECRVNYLLTIFTFWLYCKVKVNIFVILFVLINSEKYTPFHFRGHPDHRRVGCISVSGVISPMAELHMRAARTP